MVELTTQERLIWQHLHTRASAASTVEPLGACLHYVDLARLIDPDVTWRYPMTRPPFRGLNDALGHVSQYEHERGRPLLSSLVTTVDQGQPGAGFALFAAQLGLVVDEPERFWREEVAKTVEYWSSGAHVLALDASIECLRNELLEIRRQLQS